MRTGPPRLVEWFVRLLIPPACREHVLGDLWERNSCLRDYLRDAAPVIVCVLVSRIRRTTDPAVLLMEALVFYMSLIGASYYFGEQRFLYADNGLLRLAAPVAVALLAFMLADAYADPENKLPLKPALQGAFGIAIALLSQATLAPPDMAIPSRILFAGCLMSLGVISGVRMLFAPDDHRPTGAG